MGSITRWRACSSAQSVQFAHVPRCGVIQAFSGPPWHPRRILRHVRYLWRGWMGSITRWRGCSSAQSVQFAHVSRGSILQALSGPSRRPRLISRHVRYLWRGWMGSLMGWGACSSAQSVQFGHVPDRKAESFYPWFADFRHLVWTS
jgi:hypothetical protein